MMKKRGISFILTVCTEKRAVEIIHTIQLPNAGDDTRSFRILTVLFNRIDRLQVPNYNLYSVTLFYTNVSISTWLRCVMSGSIFRKFLNLTKLLAVPKCLKLAPSVPKSYFLADVNV